VLRDFGTYATRGEPEPVGVDDLRRRGSYDRLLLSEWVLADEVPDEFDRRAAQGEHLFLHPRLATARGEHGTVALFDAGPAQIGAARLLQVALWILLARRSRAAGGSFLWGSLQRPGRLDGAERADQLKTFLANRSLDRVGADGLADWARRWSEPDLPAGERWLIGPVRRDLAGATHQVTLLPRLDGRITLRIDSGSRTRTLEIDPAPSPASTQLLGGHFLFEPSALPLAAGKRGSDSLSLTQPPLIAPGGRRILVPLVGTNAARIWTRNTTSRPNAGKWKAGRQHWRQGTDLLSVAFCPRGFGGLRRRGDSLNFWNLTGFSGLCRTTPAAMKASPGRAHWLPSAWGGDGRGGYALHLVDAGGQLWRWQSRTSLGDQAGAAATPPLDHGVIALAADQGDSVVYARHRADRMELVWHGSAGERTLLSLDRGAGVEQAVLGSWRGINGWSAALAMPEDLARSVGTAWAVAEWRNLTQLVNRHTVTIPARLRVIGIGQSGVTDLDRVALYAIDPDRRHLHRIDLRGVDEVIYSHPVPIATVTMATDVPLIALVDERRQAMVIDAGEADGRYWKPWMQVRDDAD
jgi:hypothetical protein